MTGRTYPLTYRARIRVTPRSGWYTWMGARKKCDLTVTRDRRVRRARRPPTPAERRRTTGEHCARHQDRRDEQNHCLLHETPFLRASLGWPYRTMFLSIGIASNVPLPDVHAGEPSSACNARLITLFLRDARFRRTADAGDGMRQVRATNAAARMVLAEAKTPLIRSIHHEKRVLAGEDCCIIQFRHIRCNSTASRDVPVQLC